MKIVGISCCPTGIAHTYMTAEAIKKVAKKHGIECKMETQGTIGKQNVLTPQDIAQADAVVLACGISPSGAERFSACPEKVVEVPYDGVLKDPEMLIRMLKERGLLSEEA